MHIVVTQDVDRYVAEAVLARWHRIRTLGLPTGHSPEGAYGWLVQYFYDGRLSFADKTTFNLDEYLELAPNDPASYRATMHRSLMQYVDLPAARFRVPPGLATDVDAACAAYEAEIAAAGGMDLCLLGIGANGHIAFNEPGSSKESRTRRVTLAPRTRARFAEAYGLDLARVPREGVTVGIATILEAMELLLVAKGAVKATAVAKAIRGPQTAELPASFLQGHPQCTVALDHAAAACLFADLPEGTAAGDSSDGLRHRLTVVD